MGSSDLEHKRRLQMALFPEGVYYSVKNHQYLTTKINELVRASAFLARVPAEKQKENFQDFLENSLSVARKGKLFNLLFEDLPKFRFILQSLSKY